MEVCTTTPFEWNVWWNIQKGTSRGTDEGTAGIMYKGTNRGGIADWVWLKRNSEKELNRAMDEEE